MCSPISSPASRRALVSCLAFLAAPVLLAAPAHAAFVYFSPATPIAIPADGTTGYYMDVTTGNFGPVGTIANPSVGWYTTFSGPLPMLHFGVPSGTGSGYQGASLNSPLNLAPGTIIGPSSSFYNGTGLNAAFHQSGTEIAGFKFVNPTTGITNYGWMEVMTTSGGGYPAAVVDWGYDDAGASVQAGINSIPEPASLTSTLALSALPLLRRRR